MTGRRWFSENLHRGIRFSLEANDVLFEQRGEHQQLALIENDAFGRVLMLDEVVQVTSKDEFIYHEMMSHVPLLAHGAARDVLIVGGGDCGMAEEVLKHRGVDRLTQVEIDRSVVAFSREYFGDFNAPVFADGRFDLVIADGMAFVADTERRFDVILIDSTDPIGPGEVLFSAGFYAGCKRCLKPGGVLATQNGVPFLQGGELVSSIAHFSRLFTDAGAYIAAIPTYVGGHMAFGWASDDPALREVPVDVLAERFATTDFETRYYTPEVHRAAFALPRYIGDLVAHGKQRAAAGA